MKKTASPLEKHHLPLDKEVALKYVTYLVEKRIADLPETRRAFCEGAGLHPKLLYANPHIGEIAGLFQDRPSIDRLGDLTLREYLVYHHYYVRLGARHGVDEVQQRWLGQPVEKSPFDCWVYQEILWEARPDFVVELGVGSGGATHFLASVLDLIGNGEVIGVDVNLAQAKAPEGKRIHYIEGSSTAPETVAAVRARVADKRVVVIAGSGRGKDHVLAEVRAYAPFVHVGGYLIVEDCLDDLLALGAHPGEGPRAAARAFLAEDDRFAIDRRWAERYVMTLNPDGFLVRTK